MSQLVWIRVHSRPTFDFGPSTLDIRPSTFEYLFPLIKGGAGGCPNRWLFNRPSNSDFFHLAFVIQHLPFVTFDFGP